MRAAGASITSASLLVVNDVLAAMLLSCLGLAATSVAAILALDAVAVAVQAVLAGRAICGPAGRATDAPSRKSGSGARWRTAYLAMVAASFVAQAVVVMVEVRHGGRRVAEILMPLGALYWFLQPAAFLFAVRAIRFSGAFANAPASLASASAA